jgi:hypothetical protein
MGDVATELLKQGPLGIVTLLCVYGMAVLWRKLAERDATIAALQEARVQAMQKQTEALVGAATAMTKQAETSDETNALLRQIATEYQMKNRGRP